jgi:hypothetical protein
MALDLTSTNAKIARAEEHVGLLHDELVAWGKFDPYRATAEFNADHTRLAFVMHANPAASLKRASLILSDCLHNLRCAVDHLAYAVASHQHKGPNPLDVGKGFAFVLADDELKFRQQAGSKQLAKFLSPAAIDAMEAVQPYRRLHPPFRTGPLAVLRDLNNADKHHLLLDLFSPRGHGRVKVVSNPDRAKWRMPDAPAERLEDGKEFCFLAFDRPAPNVKYEFEHQVLVGVDYGGTPWYLPDAASLTVAEVRHIVGEISAKV